MDLARPHFDKTLHVTMDNRFTSPKLVKDLLDRGTSSTASVIVTRKGMPASFKTARLPKGTVIAKSKGQLFVVLFSDRRLVNSLTTSKSARLVCGFLKTNIYTYTSVSRLPSLNHCYISCFLRRTTGSRSKN